MDRRNDVTSLAMLPVGNGGMPGGGGGGGGGDMAMGGGGAGGFGKYAPLDVHKNPYGLGPHNPNLMPPPIDDTEWKRTPGAGHHLSGGGGMTAPLKYDPDMASSSYGSGSSSGMDAGGGGGGGFGAGGHPMHGFPMPNAQTPYPSSGMDTLSVSSAMDPHKHVPQFVPPAAGDRQYNHEYVNKFHDETQELSKSFETRRYQREMLELSYAQIQTPILLIVMYVFFQLPVVQSMLHSTLPFLPLFQSDGNLTLYGIVVKAILFGSLYYAIMQAALSL